MATMPTMVAALRGLKRVHLDASVFIDYVGAAPRSIRPLSVLISQIQKGTIEAVTSTVVLPEILAIAGTDARNAEYENLLKWVRVVPVSEEIAREAARLRFDYRLFTPDSVHVATASREGCQALITADAADLERTGGLPLSGGGGNLRIIVPQRLTR